MGQENRPIEKGVVTEVIGVIMAVEEEVDFLLCREVGKYFPIAGWIGHK